MEENRNYDAVIVGGSYAGLSAAMTLGRAMRKVLVIDNGKPCNEQTPHSHNFLTQDGRTPAEISSLAKSQVMAYPTVEFMEDTVSAVDGEDLSFMVSTLAGRRIKAKKLIFTTGIRDLMPGIQRFAECWGISVIHCPYCHGYEYRGQVTGLLSNGETALDFARLVRNWTDQLVIFTNGQCTMSAAQQDELKEMKITIIEKTIQELVHQKGYLDRLVFSDGESYPLAALYARLPFEQHCQIPQDLGCALTNSGHIEVNEMQQTSIDGIYAAGDNSTLFRSVSAAVAAGSKAAAVLNHQLIAHRL
ncbi:NAD(P)/FAD-dependent oxidoreductase [Pedobacter sp. AW31-3R]|uniref:NAD(P)/FAD-dependent oxidoreductase n=1 Tax=Pedobacter sp. AW31-3R TaxID=3445781 RepID=UPI003F9F00D7